MNEDNLKLSIESRLITYLQDIEMDYMQSGLMDVIERGIKDCSALPVDLPENIDTWIEEIRQANMHELT